MRDRPMEWHPPTRRDRLLAQKAAQDAREQDRRVRLRAKGLPDLPPAEGPVDTDQVAETAVDLQAPFPCPGTPHRRCRIQASSSMVRDVAAWPAAVTGGALELCDSCCDFLIRSAVIDPGDAVRLQGAPASYVSWVQEKWDADPTRPQRAALRGVTTGG